MLLFQTPYIESIQEDKQRCYADILAKSSTCGSISISQSSFTYRISCGLKIGKGNIPINQVNLNFVQNKLVVTSSTNSKKKLLVVACSKQLYERLNLFVSEMVKGYSSTQHEKKKRDLFGDQ